MEKRSQRSHQQQRSPKKGSAAKHKTLLGIAIVLLVMLTGIGCGFLTASMNTKSDLADGLAIVLASHEPALLEAIGAREVRLGVPRA